MSSYGYSAKQKVYPRLADVPYNIFRDTDGYKYCHWQLVPDTTTSMKIYFSHRGGRYANLQFATLQRIVHRYIARKPEMWMYEEMCEFCPAYGVDANLEGFKKIVELGYWPVTIKAAKEGSLLPANVPIITVEAQGDMAWAGPFIEDIIMRAYLGTMTASVSYHIRKIFEPWVQLSCENNEWLKYMLIGFGARATGEDQARALTAGHLFNFCQDDTAAGVFETNHYYNHKMSGTSVWASEHNTTIIWRKTREIEAYRQAIMKCPRGKILSLVIDSYESMRGIDLIYSLNHLILERDIKLTIRPDSGLPNVEHKACRDKIEKLWGTHLNGKAFKVFNQGVHLLYGDGMKEPMIAQIMKEAVGDDRFSAENFLFGSGEHLLQDFTRGTNGFNMKLCYATVDGQGISVCKETREKKTLAGDVDLVIVKGKYEALLKQADFGSQLDLVYSNGQIYRHHTLDEIRTRVWGEF